jgi:hypothetical protein
MDNEFAVVNDPQVEELIDEISGILKQFNIKIILTHRGSVSSTYEIIKIKKVKD